MTLFSITYEPWESIYTAYLAPGVISWIGAAIWWTRKRDRWLPIVVQVASGFGVALGGVAAYMAGVAMFGAGMIESGSWDPSLDAGTRAFVAEVALIAWWLHWALLIGTLVMAIATSKRKSKNAQQAGAQNP